MLLDSAPPTHPIPHTAMLSMEQMSATSKMLDGVPKAGWTYGCAPTAAGMLFGYYDSHGYSNMYAGDVPSYMGTSHPLIASPEHVADYWTAIDAKGPDPWVSNGSEHEFGDCVADFTGSNQWRWDYVLNDGLADASRDGATTLFATSGTLYDYTPVNSKGEPQADFTHGLRLFVEARGYSVAFSDGHYQNYTANIDTRGGSFTYADYVAEIDAGRPVLIQLSGHTMLGVGYDPSLYAKGGVLVHDTWGDYVAQMEWGGYYSGRVQKYVTVLELDPYVSSDVPEPASCGLFLVGVAVLAYVTERRRRAQAAD